MRITEKKLLDNYSGITNSGNLISTINGIVYHWNYGTVDNGFNFKIDRYHADSIKVSNYGYNMKIIPIGYRCMNKIGYSYVKEQMEKWVRDNCE